MKIYWQIKKKWKLILKITAKTCITLQWLPLVLPTNGPIPSVLGCGLMSYFRDSKNSYWTTYNYNVENIIFVLPVNEPNDLRIKRAPKKLFSGYNSVTVNSGISTLKVGCKHTKYLLVVWKCFYNLTFLFLTKNHLHTSLWVWLWMSSTSIFTTNCIAKLLNNINLHKDTDAIVKPSQQQYQYT